MAGIDDDFSIKCRAGIDAPVFLDDAIMYMPGGVSEITPSQNGVLVNGSVEQGAKTVGGVPELLVEIVEELL